MGVIEDLADALAADTLAAADEFDDPNLVDEVAKVILSQSQTLQEAFMTAVRVRKSERAGRKFLKDKIAGYQSAGDSPVNPNMDNPALG